MTDTAAASTDYVTRAGWASNPGRADHVDEVADTFERSGAEDFWSGISAGWPAGHHRPSGAQGWLERRAG